MRLVQEARALGVAVAVACRSAEARRLEDGERPGIEALLSKEHLEGYDDGRAAADATQHVGAPWEPGSELDRAVEAHLRVFCRDPGRPSPRQGSDPGGTGPAEPLAQRMRSTLVYAAARGLPLGQLIRHPLSLRMVFDIYAPAGPRDKDLDVTDLFREYWDRRVTEDVRHAVFDEEPADEQARWDLSEEVRVLGLAMLRAGRPELYGADARTALVAHTALKRRDADKAVAVLLNRGVLRKSEDGRVAFHHQAFAEHAAGQALCSARRGLAATARRVTEHPDDLLLAEAARHAFHIADREGAADWYLALDPLMRHRHAATRLTALRIHAGLRHPPENAVKLAVETLRAADPWQTASYVTVLTGTSKPATAAWPRTLRAIWDRQDSQERRRVLIAVTHLAHQQPQPVASFLSGLGLLDFTERENLNCLPYGRDLTLFLLGLHTAAPEKCATGVTTLLNAAATFRNKAVLLHTLGALAHLTARYPGRYAGHAASLPELLDGLHQAWQADLDKIIGAAAPVWATTLRTATATQIEDVVRTLADGLKAGSPVPSGALRLRSLAEVLATGSRQLVQSCLDRLSGAAGAPESAEPVAKYLLAPLLAQEPALSGVAAARDWCRRRLSRTDDLDTARGATGVVVKALDTDKVPLPAATVAACLPTPRDPDRCREDTLRRWLSDPWPVSLTVAAAAGGHRVAERALDLHISMDPPATGAHAVRLREAMGRRAADHPGPLLGRLQDRGREIRATVAPPYDDHARQFMLAANEAYLLRIALHAHFGDLTARPPDELLGPLESLVFADLPLFLPPNDPEIALHAWRRRFEHLPHLCRRLAAEGYHREARGLLDRVIDFTNRVHPSGKGKWREGLANDWRRYLRVVSLEDREQFTDTVPVFALRDIAFAKQLVEVAGQSLGDIAPELYALMRDPDTPPALMPALRSTASWAGRAGQGAPWTEIFAEVAWD